MSDDKFKMHLKSHNPVRCSLGDGVGVGVGGGGCVGGGANGTDSKPRHRVCSLYFEYSNNMLMQRTSQA